MIAAIVIGILVLTSFSLGLVGVVVYGVVWGIRKIRRRKDKRKEDGE